VRMRDMTSILVPLLAFVLVCAAHTVESSSTKQDLRFEVKDARGQAIPCRIHVTDAAGRPQQASGLPFWHDHFVCDGKAVLQVTPGRYRYEIERGPEYQPVNGSVEVPHEQTVAVQLDRIVNLAKDGWFSGDLHVHRPINDMALLMQAEDMHIAPVITWWNRTNLWAGQEIPATLLQRVDGQRFYHIMGGEDERDGGALLFFGLQRPLEIARATREYPSSMKFISDARQIRPDAWIDIEKPFWWDVPLWLASGKVDSIGVANNHMQRSGMLPNEAWGRPRDKQRLPDPLGNGYWTQELYYHILNCGLRLPPSAGSASGVLANPVGYNRVYVHVDGELDYGQWWRQLKAGRCFVTNGPLLLCKADGQLPGHVFRAGAGQQLDLKVELSLIANDRVGKVEIIKNGRVDSSIEANEAPSQQRTGRVSFTESGWFLVRAIADNPRTFRFASTAPFFVEIGQQKQRISRHSAQFFLDWVVERGERVRATIQSPDELREVLAYHESAKRYWQDVVKRANAE
jgi:hypothetical protein